MKNGNFLFKKLLNKSLTINLILKKKKLLLLEKKRLFLFNIYIYPSNLN
jgi:hypothetical protein